MLVNIKRTDLIEALENSIKAVSKKPQIEIIGYTHISCSDEIKITGYNLTLGIVSTVNGEVLQKGACCFEGATVLNFIKKCSEESVSLIVENNQMTITCGKPKLKLSVRDDSDFPILPDLKSTRRIEIQDLSDKISKVAFCTAENTQKPVMSGVNIKASNGILTMTGCDGNRFSVISEECEAANINITIPKNVIENIKSIVENKKISIDFDEKNIKIDIENITIYARLLSGEYLNLSSFISRSGGISFAANGKRVLEALERLSVIAEPSSPLVVKLEKDVMSLYCKTPKAELEELVTTDYKGEDLKIGFNFKYFFEAIKGTEEVNFDILNATSGLLIKEKNRVQMVLPVRIKA